METTSSPPDESHWDAHDSAVEHPHAEQHFGRGGGFPPGAARLRRAAMFRWRKLFWLLALQRLSLEGPNCDQTPK